MANHRLSSDLMLSSIIYLITDDEVSRQKQTMQMRSSRNRGGEHLSANRIIITYPAWFRETGNIAPTSHAGGTEIDTRIFHRQPVVLLPSLIMSCLRVFPWNEEQFIRESFKQGLYWFNDGNSCSPGECEITGTFIASDRKGASRRNELHLLFFSGNSESSIF